MEVLQVKSELVKMVELYREKRPARVLEIGCWDGGTLREWLTKHTPEVVVAVDLDHRNRDAYQEWRHPDTSLHLYVGHSQDDAQIAGMRSHAPYDWVFIDADHDEEPVRSDAEVCYSCVRPGGLMLFHDIVPGPGLPVPGPGIVLEELRQAGHKVREIVEDPGGWEWAHGIGIVQL